jgi:hypothetical protein
MKQKHYKYFIGHKKPEFPIWEDFSFYQPPHADFSESNSFCEIYSNHKIFNEYASLFHLRRAFDNSINLNELITICQYRRFVFNKKLGKQTINMPWSTVLTYSEMQSLKVINECSPLTGNTYLIGSAIQVPSILQQYAADHFLRDILQFTSTLIDLGILTNEDAFHFLNSNHLIPSPSCGTFTLGCFIEIFKVLELAAEGFWNNGYQSYDDPYQSRVMSFLLERLNSFLLISYLNKSALNITKLLGFTTMVTPENSDTVYVTRGLAAKS